MDKKNIILPQPLPTHQASHTLEILTKQFWLTVLPDSKDSRDTMYSSRLEQMNTDRKIELR